MRGWAKHVCCFCGLQASRLTLEDLQLIAIYWLASFILPGQCCLQVLEFSYLNFTARAVRPGCFHFENLRHLLCYLWGYCNSRQTFSQSTANVHISKITELPLMFFRVVLMASNCRSAPWHMPSSQKEHLKNFHLNRQSFNRIKGFCRVGDLCSERDWDLVRPEWCWSRFQDVVIVAQPMNVGFVPKDTRPRAWSNIQLSSKRTPMSHTGTY